MGPLPKRQLGDGRRDPRRVHDAIGTPNLSECGNCHQPVLPHRVCPHCGYYKGRQVLNLDAGKPDKK